MSAFDGNDELKKMMDFPKDHHSAFTAGYLNGQKSICDTLVKDVEKQNDALVLQIGELTKDRDSWKAAYESAVQKINEWSGKAVEIQGEKAAVQIELKEQLRLNERMKNVVDAACAYETYLSFDDLNSAYRDRREATDAFAKAVGEWKTWLPEKRNNESSKCCCDLVKAGHGGYCPLHG